MDTHFEQNLPRSPATPELTLPGENEPMSTLHAEPKDRLVGAPVSSPAEPADGAPGETPTVEVGAEAQASKPAGKPATKRRSALMTSAAVGVTLVAAAGIFLISPYNHIVPLNLAGLSSSRPAQPGATQHIAIPAPVAPAANLARAPTPQATPAPSRPAANSQPHAAELQEIFGLRPGNPGRDVPPVDKPAGDPQAAAPIPSPAPGPVAETQASPSTPLPATPVVAPVPATPTPPAVTAPVPSDPVTRAATLQAAPMSTPQQVEVLDVVTQLGVLLRNQRAENAQLREDVQQMRQRLDTQLNDYGHRLSLAEARGAINAAMGAGTPATAPATNPGSVMPASITVLAPSPAGAGAASRGPRATTPALPAAPVTAAPQDTARRYRVQAASPGLAMLAEVDRTGDAGNLLQVSIGDDVPGYGKVKSIAQQGAAWVLTAERGTIR
jgi:hypothetical protein